MITKPLNLSYCVGENVLVGEMDYPRELTVISAAPSRQFVKVRYVSDNETFWIAADGFEIIEVLTTNAAQNANKTPTTPSDR